MAISYTSAKVFTFPPSQTTVGNPAVSGYTGIRTPEAPNVLTNFLFTLEHNWVFSKIISVLWRESFEQGPSVWEDIPCSGTYWGNPCVERPSDVYGRPKATTSSGFPDGGFDTWMLYPNFYNDGGGRFAGYIPHEKGRTSEHCMRVISYGKPIIPPDKPKVGGYGGVWLDFDAMGITKKQHIGAWYRLTFWEKKGPGHTPGNETGLSGEVPKVVWDCQDTTVNCAVPAHTQIPERAAYDAARAADGLSDQDWMEECENKRSTNMRNEFVPQDNWTKHTHLFQADRKTRRVAIWTSHPDMEVLLDDIILEEVEITPAPPSRDVLWDFGDGTFATGLTARHTYTWSGIYDVRSILYDEYGQQVINTIAPSVSAFNVVDDWLALDYSVPNFTAEIPAGEMGFDPSIPKFKVDRWNSFQTWPGVSGSAGYTLFLHASGSPSKRLNVANFYNEKWSHLDQTWSFYQDIIAGDGTTDWEPISEIGTTTEKIYYRITDLDFNIAQCAPTDPGASFVGTSGSGQFKYVDDLPKHNYPDTKNTSTESKEPPVLLIASFDTTNFPTERAAAITRVNTFNASNLPTLEGPKLTIPIKTVPTPGFGFKLTATGQTQMPITKIKWQGSAIPFFVTTTNKHGYNVETYPPLEGNYGTDVPFEGIINITLRDSWGNVMPGGFYTDSLAQLPGKIKSRLAGHVVPEWESFNSTFDGASISAHMTAIRPFSGLVDIYTLPDPDRAYVAGPVASGCDLYKVISLKNNIQVQYWKQG